MLRPADLLPPKRLLLPQSVEHGIVSCRYVIADPEASHATVSSNFIDGSLKSTDYMCVSTGLFLCSATIPLLKISGRAFHGLCIATGLPGNPGSRPGHVVWPERTSAAPTRMPGTRPSGNPLASAPGRSATGGRSRAGGTPGPRASAPGISPVDASRTPPPAGGPGPSRRPGRRRRRPSACRRPATGRRRRTPHSPAPREPQDPETRTPTRPICRGRPWDSPPERVQLRSPIAPGFSRAAVNRRRRRRDRPDRRAAPGYTAAPNSCRSAAPTSAVVAARNPPPRATPSAPPERSPVECTDRDAPFVLDGVLYHESDLDREATKSLRAAVSGPSSG